MLPRVSMEKAKTSEKKAAKAKKEKDEKKDKKVEKNKKEERANEKDAKKKKENKDKKEKEDTHEADKKARKEREAKAKREKEDKDKAAKEKAVAEAREAKTAAFTAWPQADAQAMLDKVEEAKGSIGLMSGRFKKEELLALDIKAAAPQAPAAHPGGGDSCGRRDEDRRWVGAEQASEDGPCVHVVEVAADACNFRASQGEPAAAASVKAAKWAGDGRWCFVEAAGRVQDGPWKKSDDVGHESVSLACRLIVKMLQR